MSAAERSRVMREAPARIAAGKPAEPISATG
jgi:hypothetical protein